MTAELDTANSVCIDALNQLNSAIRAFADIKPITIRPITQEQAQSLPEICEFCADPACEYIPCFSCGCSQCDACTHMMLTDIDFESPCDCDCHTYQD